MARFLAGGGFQNIIRDFGRPVVRHWTGLACLRGTSRAPHPRSASRRLTTIPVDPDPDGTGLGLATAVEQAVDDLRQLARREAVHTAALAIDPHHWQLARFVLWNGDAAAVDARPSATSSCTCRVPASARSPMAARGDACRADRAQDQPR